MENSDSLFVTSGAWDGQTKPADEKVTEEKTIKSQN